MRILVTDGMDKTAMAELKAQGHEVVEQFYEPAELGKALRDFDVVVVRSKTKVRAAQIEEAKGSQLKLIIRGGVGVDNIDVDYAKAAGIDVKNTPRASSESVAELAMAHMFSCARYISHAGYTMRNGQWEKKAYGKGIELCGKTLGVVGFGRIGQKLGVMAKAKVIYDFLDQSKMFKGTVEPEFRSLMNIPFVTESAELDAEVVAATKAAGYDNLKGHKSVGGLRASVYNAMPIEGAEALVEFLKKFEAEHTK